MKTITAIIKPFKLDEVKGALKQVGASGMTVMSAQGMGCRNGTTELYRGAEYVADLVPQYIITIIVHDNKVTETATAILKAARTGCAGDGIIIVSAVEKCWSIRTGDNLVTSELTTVS